MTIGCVDTAVKVWDDCSIQDAMLNPSNPIGDEGPFKF